MEKIERIREEVKNANARIREREQENEKRAAELVKAWKREGDKFKKYDITPAEQESNERLERAMANAEQENKRDKLRAEILRENLKAAIFETLKPIIWDTLKKYNGKPYGDKTRDKIAEETKAACGYRVYFAERYGNGEIKAYDVASYNNADNITIYAHNIPIFGGELKNRLREPSEEEKTAFSVAYERARYTEPAEIDAVIDAIIAAHKAAEEAEKAYNAAVARYNDLRPNANEAAKTMYNGVPRI